MWNYRARWKFIGVQLGIDMGTLDTIEKDYKMADDCLLRMINGWLRNCPRPTREAIRVALRSKHVSNAAGIEYKIMQCCMQSIKKKHDVYNKSYWQMIIFSSLCMVQLHNKI